MKHLFILCILFSLALIGPAQARSSVPLVDIENYPLATVSGKPLTLDIVQSALNYAGATKKWTLEHIEPGHAIGSLVVRGKHTIRVDIRYSNESLTIKYKDSVNMKYEMDNDIPKIHPNYNAWISELAQGVKLEMVRY